MISISFRQADPERKKLTEKYGEEEDVRTRDGPREKWLFGDGEKPPPTPPPTPPHSPSTPPAASGSGSSILGIKIPFGFAW